MYILSALVCTLLLQCSYDNPSVHCHNVALDPNYKVAYAKDKWTHCHFDEGMKRLGKVVSLHPCTQL